MKVVIVGSGPAGVTAAETLRQYDRQSEIVMLTDEPYPPYSRPAMAEYFLVAYNILGWDLAYEGADNMNSLKHLGLPIMAVGHMEGEELRARRNGSLRKIYLQDDRIVGFRLAGDVRAAGLYLGLMNRREPVGAMRQRLLEPGFGVGFLESRARSFSPVI